MVPMLICYLLSAICHGRVAAPVGRAKARPHTFVISEEAQEPPGFWLLYPGSFLITAYCLPLTAITAHSNHTPQRSAGVWTGASQSLVN
jgi:hypothetical protein